MKELKSIFYSLFACLDLSAPFPSDTFHSISQILSSNEFGMKKEKFIEKGFFFVENVVLTNLKM
jgi:hypothetical protein